MASSEPPKGLCLALNRESPVVYSFDFELSLIPAVKSFWFEFNWTVPTP